MKQKIYSIKDVATGFTKLIVLPNDYAALRTFNDIVNNPQDTFMQKNAKDFSLFCLGEIEIETGNMTSEIRLISSAIDIQQKSNENL